MSFQFRPAQRVNVPLVLGFAGGTGSGKTNSALRVAKGLAGNNRFAVIDTEAGRALHYAEDFEFDHAVLEPPFRPARYLEAIKAAEKASYPVIVVDSMSHEWDGTGGMLDWHDEIMGGQESKKLAAWIKPKSEHRKFVSELLQLRTHLILCFRAAQKVEMVKGAGGKWEIVAKESRTGLDGWIPICEKSLPFELTMSLLLLADQPGVPHPIKLEGQHRPFVPLDSPLTEQTGVALARWAAGKPAGSGGGGRRRRNAAEPEVDPELEAERERLVGEILALALNDEKRAEMAEKIEAQRAKQDDPGAHLAWLGAQHERLQELAAKRDQEQLDL